MIKLQWRHTGGETETWWDNFYDHCYEIQRRDRYDFVTEAIIDELKKWDAIFDLDDRCVIFRRKRDATMFLLRWA